MRIAIAGATGAVGRPVVDAAERAGHSVVPLARAHGIDLTAGTGLAEALSGVDAVIDVASVSTMSTKESVEFFSTVTRNLLAAERAAGVGHHVALSIVGIDGVDSGYYAGKLAQEALVTASDVPWTLLRATQFHEFAAQTLKSTTFGPIAMLPLGPVQPVAASEVGQRLVQLAEAGPAGRVNDLAGPRPESLVDLGRRYLRATGKRTPVVGITAPFGMLQAMRRGRMLPAAGADLGRQTYDEWLATL